MFRQIISSTPFTTDIANATFNNIGGDTYRGDVSFIATLRALVAPRLKDGESIRLTHNSSSYTASQLSEFSTDRAVRSISCANDMVEGQIKIHNFTSNQVDNMAWIKAVESTFLSVYPEWQRFEKVTDFYRKTFYTVCFVNPTTRNVIIFADNLDIRKWHYLQCSIVAFLTWYFSPEEGLNAEEMALVKSLREKTSDEYLKCLEKLAEQYDFETIRIKSMLSGFETRYEERECQRVRNTINSVLEDIRRYNIRIGELLSQKNDHEIRLLGLEQKIANSDEESEIMDYFIRNKKLHLLRVDTDVLDFAVKDYLEYYDEDMAQRAIDNNTSYIYVPNGRRCNNIIPAEDMKKLMTAIFIDRELRIKFCAKYRFRLHGNVDGMTWEDGIYGFEDCTPNTHIDAYHCLGSYERNINEYLSRNDYIGAIEQCTASCKSLNFGDSTVMQRFMCRLYEINNDDINIRCIELPDGSIVNPKEAIEWLKSQDESTEEVADE